MNTEIHKLLPELAEDYVRFFDFTPHNLENHTKCYCVCWCSGDSEGKDFSSPEKRREYALQYVRNKNLQGYLAYHNDIVVGWCNANTKSDCLKCGGWRHCMGSVPIDDALLKIKSVFCFTIAPEMQRQGIAAQLLARVCQDAAEDGFDFVEAYPDKESAAGSDNFAGHADMYKKNGFIVHHETNRLLIMRKQLKHQCTV